MIALGWLAGCRDPGGGPDAGGHTASPVAEVGLSCDPTRNPLRFTCRVTVDPPGPAELRVAREDGSGERVIQLEEAAAEHTPMVVLLAGDTDYRAVATSGEGRAETTFHTGSAPLSVASSLEVTGSTGTPYVGLNVPCTPNQPVTGIYDTATGELVWYEELSPTGSLAGFNTASFTEDHTVVGLTGSVYVEVDLTGAVLLRKAYDRYYNHDLFRRDGLTWLIYSDTVDRLTLQGLAVWDRQGNEVGSFSMRDWDIPSGIGGDWTHANSVWIDEDHDAYVSLYTQDTIVKLDGDPGSPTFGRLEWALAGDDGGGLGQDFAVDWSRISGEDGFRRQHAASIDPSGHLQFLDNDHGRGLVASLDEAAGTAIVREGWPTDRAPCGPQGTATTTPDGHRLVGCSGAWVREYDGESPEPVWTAHHVCEAPPPDIVIGINRWYPLVGW